MLTELISISSLDANNEKMIDVRHIARYNRRDDPLEVCKSCIVKARAFFSQLIPVIEVFELDKQNRRLQSIEPAGVADEIMLIFFDSAMITKLTYSERNSVIAGDDGTRVTARPQIFGGIKAEAGSVS